MSAYLVAPTYSLDWMAGDCISVHTTFENWLLHARNPPPSCPVNFETAKAIQVDRPVGHQPCQLHATHIMLQKWGRYVDRYRVMHGSGIMRSVRRKYRLGDAPWTHPSHNRPGSYVIVAGGCSKHHTVILHQERVQMYK